MLPPRERRRGEERRLIGEREQRFEVVAPRPGHEQRQLVDHFLSRRLNPGDEPPHGRMEPERGTQRFFDHDPGPVAPPNVPQLVREDGVLHGLGQCAQRRRQQDDRMSNAERHRLPDVVDVSHVGAGGDEVV